MRLGKRIFGAASCRLGRTSHLPAHLRDDVVELSALFCAPEQRRQGFARALVHQLCAEADEVGTLLLIHVQSYDEGGMDADQLALWYHVQFGFSAIQAEPLLMARMVGATPIATLKPVAQAVTGGAL